MIRITSKKDGFRRCGVAHDKEPRDYADDHFTQNELKILKSEPLLTVEQRDESAPALTAEKKIELIKAAQHAADLNDLAAEETRKTVLAAINHRRQELAETNGATEK